ncbi:conserved Plasmodium protein, unknown function [Plasmodium sp. DRC-Itaito]|uniref:Heptatricopeptide repeat-containing protein n=1 Tax=Plasmodium gaboni TaxID=647221 RepID=A0ABY1ULH0_9APIC|nr:conserved Plasmodium protein, unknown function [Plasmodium gaboni]SOV22056.1 conserved Plasmodium protein, unknown function [Plasmodium sp. DRC-Itaito]
MIHYVNNLKSINRKVLYKLHIENDKIIDMPLFLADHIYVRKKKELIKLLHEAIYFDREKFFNNYKKVLLNKKEWNNKNDIKDHVNNIKKEFNLVNINDKDNINNNNNNNCNSDIIYSKQHCSNIFKNCMISSFIKNDIKKPLSNNFINPYKYNNEEYDELIVELSSLYHDEEDFDNTTFPLNCFESIEEENYVNCFVEEKLKYNTRNKIYDEKNIDNADIYNYYILIGYIPNDLFFSCIKNRIISLKSFFSYSELFSFIYLFHKRNDIRTIKLLGEEYIKRMCNEKDRIVDNKHIIYMLNIFIKMNYNNNNKNNICSSKHIFSNFLQNIYIKFSHNNLKLLILSFTCLSRINEYNILFYEHISNFIDNISSLSTLACSMILHSIGYYKFYMKKIKTQLFQHIRNYKQIKNYQNKKKKIISDKNEIFKDHKREYFQHENDITKYIIYNNNNNNDSNNYNNYIALNKGERNNYLYDNKESTHTRHITNQICYKNICERNIINLDLTRKHMNIIKNLENKIIEKLLCSNIQDIDSKSISSIFHYYYLSQNVLLNLKDQQLFNKLLNILINNNVNFMTPRHFLMCSYTLILHKYFTNIDIASYFLFQCAKLIKLLKKQIYIDNLFFILIGFSQNHLIFYNNKKNHMKGTTSIYIDNNNNNKFCNYKIEKNKYIDILQKSQYELNLLTNQNNVTPSSSRAAILYILNEITNLDYELNTKQMILFLQLFSSFNIKFSTDIKQKLFSLIINNTHNLIKYIHLILPGAIKIYGITSNYIKTICLNFLEKMDNEINRIYNLLLNGEFNMIYNFIQTNNIINDNVEYTFIFDINILSDILYIFDQIDVNKKDFIDKLTNLLYFNNYYILTYKKNSFNSFVYLLHYISSSYDNEKKIHKLQHFLYTNVSEYLNISFKQYIDHIKSHNNHINNINKPEDNNSQGDNYFNEVTHNILTDKIYMKDLILLLDSIRINKAYDHKLLINNLINIMNTEKITLLSDEDIELINYIFIDMGLMNNPIMNEAKKRGLSMGLNS